MATPANSATPTNWWNSSAAKPATGSTSKWPPIPRSTRRRARRTDDLANFKRKVDAGANSAITQYFYNADAYFRFVDEARALGVNMPIVPGIMPIANYAQLARFSDACGAEIPRWMRKKLESYGDDVPSIRAFGLDVVTDLCDRLLAGGAPGLHFYTMNQAGAEHDDLAAAGLVKTLDRP